MSQAQLSGALAGVEASRLDGLVVAYEPVWAIGTGRTATPGSVFDAQARMDWDTVAHIKETFDIPLILKV